MDKLEVKKKKSNSEFNIELDVIRTAKDYPNL